MSLDDFFTKNTGKQLADHSGNFLGECVSLAKQYAQSVQGVPNADTVLQVPNGARQLYEGFNWNGKMSQYYDKISYGQPRQKGDLVVWGSNLGQYGDVAIALDSGNTVFGQLGTPVFKPANTRVETRPPLGYLRLKGGNKMTEAQAAELALYIRLLAFESVDEANSHSKDDVAHIVADPAYAAGIAKAVYSGEWQQPAWRAGHYDADVKSAYNKGRADAGAQLPAGTYVKVDKDNAIEVK